MSSLWYSGAATFEEKKSKSIIHLFSIKSYKGLAINPYQGCGHRCAYCYATYEWSPEFYDKVYAKSNAAEVLDRQLACWKSEIIHPVMVSSATDAYQPAELRYGLTRKCVQVLQKYNVPYVVFTKSTIIERDLGLHKQYKKNCFLIWSLTTCNERIRRVIEPGTPPASKMFEVIKKFTDAGVCCGVNIDPIMPLLNDSNEELETVVRNCKKAGLYYVFGSVMRLRTDIWERMKQVLRILEIPDGVEKYKKIYNFEEPLDADYVAADRTYTEKIVGDLEERIKAYGMECGFPDYIGPRQIDKSCLGQTTLNGYLV
jgi:DNA repair photolyase